MTRMLFLLSMAGFVLCLPVSAVVAEELTSKDFIDFVKPFAGSWKTTIEVDGQIAEGTWRGRLSPTKTCYVARGATEGLPSFQSIDGYDPVTKKWTVAAFGSDGSFSLTRLKFIDIKKGQRFGQGMTATSEEKMCNNDGTTTTATCKMKCLECTENRIVNVLSDRKKNGEAKPDQTFTMERLPDRQRSTVCDQIRHMVVVATPVRTNAETPSPLGFPFAAVIHRVLRETSRWQLNSPRIGRTSLGPRSEAVVLGMNKNARCWSVSRKPQPGQYYDFVKVTQADGNMLWSATVWVTVGGR